MKKIIFVIMFGLAFTLTGCVEMLATNLMMSAATGVNTAVASKTMEKTKSGLDGYFGN